MLTTKQQVLDILQCSDIDETYKNRFADLVADKYKTARRARWIYSLAYAVVGGVAIIVLCCFTNVPSDKQMKFIGATVVVASALLALWRPETSVSQKDCEFSLSKPLPYGDLRKINELLAVKSEKADRIFKLIGALVAFLAIYLAILGGDHGVN